MDHVTIKTQEDLNGLQKAAEQATQNPPYKTPSGAYNYTCMLANSPSTRVFLPAGAVKAASASLPSIPSGTPSLQTPSVHIPRF